MLSLMDLYVSTYMHFATINKPTKPLTAVVEGRIINREQVKEDKYIQNTVEEEQWIDIIATGYCNCRICTYGTGISASGVRPSRGGIAIPTDIKLNTEFYIPELKNVKQDGIFKGIDRGGLIKRINNNTIKIDVWFPTHQEALDFGVKHLKGKIIYKNNIDI